MEHSCKSIHIHVRGMGEILRLEKKGNGTFGEVYRASMRGREYAIKELRMRNDCDIANALREVDGLSQFRNQPNILHMFGFQLSMEGNNYIVMECMEGDLYHWKEDTDEGRRYQEMESIHLQLVEGLKVLHGRGYMHRDIKPANVMYRRECTSEWKSSIIVKIGDMGSCRKILSIDKDGERKGIRYTLDTT